VKKRAPLLRGIIFVISFICLVTMSWAAPPDNFTTKMVTMGMTVPMAKMGNKTRVENVMMPDVVTISLLDQKKTITMNTKNKTYFEQTKQDKVPSMHDPNVVFEKKKIGSETIDGHPCIKYDTVFYTKDKPAEKFKAILWEAQDLGGMPVRQEMIIPEEKRFDKAGGRVVTEFKEIKVGGATASMFDVPKDYKKVTSIHEVMGMGDMQKMMQQMQKGKKAPKEE